MRTALKIALYMAVLGSAAWGAWRYHRGHQTMPWPYDVCVHLGSIVYLEATNDLFAGRLNEYEMVERLNTFDVEMCTERLQKVRADTPVTYARTSHCLMAAKSNAEADVCLR